jgi:hypothetical protein
MTIKLGTKVTDSVTGFTGIAVSRIEYMTGCTQYGVAPRVAADGKLPETAYLDESRLEEWHDPMEDVLSPRGGPGISIPEREHP